MAIKFLSGLNLSDVTAGSILKLDSNGNIVAAVDGTDYNTSTSQWTNTNGGIFYSDNVRIGTYQTGVIPSTNLHVFDYQTTDPKILIEDGNTGDASMQFKISTQSYTMGIDNSDGDTFKISAGTSFSTNGIEIKPNHYLGISGTPSAKLHVFGHGTSNGEIRIDASGDNTEFGIFRFIGDSSSYDKYLIGYNSAHPSQSDDLSLKNLAGNITFFTGTGGSTSEKLRIESGGNVGIGTTSPAAPLHVVGNIFSQSGRVYTDALQGYSANAITLGDGNNAFNIISRSSQDIGITGGNVGIGTTSPSSLLEISQQLSGASTIDYPYTISSRDDGNSINQLGGEGVGIKFRIAGNSDATPGDSLVGASIAAIRESPGDSDSSTGLGFFITQNDETLDEAVRIDHDGNVGVGTTSPGSKLSVRATTATHQLVSINRPNSDTAALYLGNNSSNDAIISGNNAPISLGKDVSGTYTEYVNIATDGELKFSAYGAGILKTNASGIVSVDTSTYVTDVDWSDIASINGTVNINSTTQIGQGDTETLVSFQNSGTERGRFEVDDSANSYFVATGFKTSTASTGFLKADGTVDTNTYSTATGVANNADVTPSWVPATDPGYATTDYVDTELTGLASESWANTNLVNVTGDTMTGKLRIDTRLQIGDDTSSSVDYIYDGFLDSNSAYFHQPKVIIRSDSSAAGGLDEAPVALAMFNRNGTNNTWVKMSFASREVNGSGNTVSIAGIAAQKTTGTANSWASGKLYLWTKNGASFVENMVLQPNGNVGVGTSSPGYKLDVAGTIRSGTTYRTSINGDSSGAVVLFGSASDNDSLGVIGAYASKFNISSGNGDISFQFNSTERMRITSGGNVGIGTDNPGHTLDVNGTVRASSHLVTPLIYSGGGNVSFGNNVEVNAEFNIKGGKVFRMYRSGGNAHQRVDARIDGSDQSRLHWYGKNDADGTANFKHAWYDGANYINVTASNPGRVTFAGSAQEIYIGSNKVATETFVTTNYKTSDDTETYVAQELTGYTPTSSFGTNAFTSYTDHSTAGYLKDSSTQDKYLRSDTSDTMRFDTSDGEMLKFQNSNSGGKIQIGFQQNDEDGLHHRAYFKAYKSAAGYAAGKFDIVIRSVNGGTTADIFELEAGAKAKWQGNNLATETFAAGEASAVQDNLDGLASSLGSLALEDSVAISEVTGLQTALDGKLSTSGGTLTGGLVISDALSSPSDLLTLRNTTTGEGASMKFTDQAPTPLQFGRITFYHQDGKSYGSGAAFVIGSDQPNTTILADGKLMYAEGIYSKPSSGTGAGTRRDSNWNAAYTYSQVGHLPLAGGTMTGDLRVTNGDNNGIRFHSGGANITSVSSGDVIIQRLTAGLRLGSSASWDYNEWAGIKFDSDTEILYIGGPSASVFSSNANPPTIDVNFVGVDEVQLNGTALATETFAAGEAQAVQDNLDTLAGSLGSAASSATTDFAAASHTHSASDITSGTLDGARLAWASNDGFTGTYPLVWKADNRPYTASWLNIRGSDDTLFTRSIDANGTVTTDEVIVASGVYHEGDTNTSVTFGTDTMNLNTGGGVRAAISNSSVKFNSNTIIAGGATLSLGEAGEEDDNGRSVLIEGAANGGNGEAAGRIFFSENNNTATNNYGLSLYYEGDPNIALPSGFRPNTGNATWSLRRHDNSVNGTPIFFGSRTNSNVTFEGTLSVPEYIYHRGDANTYIRLLTDRIQIVAGGTTKFDTSNTYLLEGTDISVKNITPAADRTYILGTDSNRWSVVFCETLDSAGQHESQLQNPEGEKSIGEYATGTVLVWKGGKNIPCTEAADHMRMGIAVNGIDSPLVQGAEPVLVTGSVNEGDYLVTSSVEGHAKAITPQFMRQHMLFDCVIGKALESGEGDSHLIKTWINI